MLLTQDHGTRCAMETVRTLKSINYGLLLHFVFMWMLPINLYNSIVLCYLCHPEEKKDPITFIIT